MNRNIIIIILIFLIVIWILFSFMILLFPEGNFLNIYLVFISGVPTFAFGIWAYAISKKQQKIVETQQKNEFKFDGINVSTYPKNISEESKVKITIKKNNTK